MVESDHKCSFADNSLSADLTLLIRFAKSMAAHSSKRGNDTVFNGATRDFAHNNLVVHLPALF